MLGNSCSSCESSASGGGGGGSVAQLSLSLLLCCCFSLRSLRCYLVVVVVAVAESLLAFRAAGGTRLAVVCDDFQCVRKPAPKISSFSPATGQRVLPQWGSHSPAGPSGASPHSSWKLRGVELRKKHSQLAGAESAASRAFPRRRRSVRRRGESDARFSELVFERALHKQLAAQSCRVELRGGGSLLVRTQAPSDRLTEIAASSRGDCALLRRRRLKQTYSRRRRRCSCWPG